MQPKIKSLELLKLLLVIWTTNRRIITFFYSNNFYNFIEKNNVDIGTSISGELDSLKKNLDKYKKSGMGEDFDDVDVQTLDWVEDNRKVKAFFIYESSL